MPKPAQLLLKLLLLLVLGGIPYYWYMHRLITENDPFYWKSTYASPHLILGVSRAKQGIAPQILEETLQLEEPALNFAFTGIHSPYGEPYFKMIQRKLDKQHGPGVSILSVHPAAMVSFKGANHRREEEFRFYDLWCVNCNPNAEYIIRNVSGGQSLLAVMLNKKLQSRPYDSIHHNGWIERSPQAPVKVDDIEDLKNAQYEPVFAPEREAYLKRTVALLRQQGEVFLVRMPVNADMKKQEEEFFYRDFDAYMQEIATEYGAQYLNYAATGDEYRFSDGIHHLDGPSAKAFTKRLAEDIKKLR